MQGNHYYSTHKVITPWYALCYWQWTLFILYTILYCILTPLNHPKLPTVFKNVWIFFHNFICLVNFYRFAKTFYHAPSNALKHPILPRPQFQRIFKFFFVLLLVLPIFIGRPIKLRPRPSFHIENGQNGYTHTFNLL